MTGEVALRSTRYVCDGVRRVQEVTTDHLPDVTTLATWSLADPVVSTAATWFDGATLPLNLELRLVRGQITAPAPPQGQTRQPITKHLTRQYIWGPGDRGLDELLVQFDGGTGLDGGKAWWPLQDAGLDLIGLCDAGIGSTMLGTVAGTGEGAGARVVGQWTYDAYGRVLTADYPVLTADGQPALCHPKMGHKGLFVERLDASGANTSTSLISNLSSDPPTLVPRATSIVQMRNRWYRADLGRFLTVDPNASGAVLLAVACHGFELGVWPDPFGLQRQMRDGVSRYQYLASTPFARWDPLGLESGQLFGPGWNQGGVFFEFDDEALAQRQSEGGDRGSSLREFGVDIAGQVGRVAGAAIAAYLFGDHVSMSNDVLGGIVNDAMSEIAGPTLGLFAGTISRKLQRGVEYRTYARTLYNEPNLNGFIDVASSWGRSQIVKAIGRSGPMSFIAMAFSIPVGMYAGVIEYLADSVGR